MRDENNSLKFNENIFQMCLYQDIIDDFTNRISNQSFRVGVMNYETKSPYKGEYPKFMEYIMLDILDRSITNALSTMQAKKR